LLEWCLGVFPYDRGQVLEKCLQSQNHSAAAVIEKLARNQEQALRHSLEALGGKQEESESLLLAYLLQEEGDCRKVALLKVAISHWAKYGLVNLGKVMEKSVVSDEVKELLRNDESAHWLVQNTTPLFLLTSIISNNEKTTPKVKTQQS